MEEALGPTNRTKEVAAAMSNKVPPSYLSPGQSVVIEVKRGETAAKGICRVLGSHAPYYMITDMPLANQKPVLTPADTWCVARALIKGKAIGFRARVEKVHVDHPFPIVILSCPGELQEVTVRKAVRISCGISVTLLAHPDQKTLAASQGEHAMPQGGATGIVPDTLTTAADAEKSNGQSAVTPMSPQSAALNAAADLSPIEAEEALAVTVPTRHRPDDPFAAVIIDLSEGGCQLAIPSIDPDVPSDLPPEVLHLVRMERRLLHHPDTLKDTFQAGDICAIQMDLPLQESPTTRETAGEIRWVRSFPHHYLLGVMFTQAPDMLKSEIRTLIDFHAKYFTPPFEPV
jgi:hypothetical protein